MHRKFLSALEDLASIGNSVCSQNKNITIKVTSEGWISDNFCANIVFNLSHDVLTETDIKVFEKGLDYAPIQEEINDPELRKDFFWL